ncbi:unnamed protein product [Mytilus coruscus]|uniref:Uncharacterized protein n=1 Tax=Mytilus coruscus TaxID=42192 RepID=A0A6J8ET27_MYTCO|nr:unnamed protein product [Mytilus coruscus]
MKNIERRNPHVPKRAESITAEGENKIWIALFYNYENDSKCLSYAVYFYNCKLFALRAADEHSDLEVSQYTFGRSEEGCYSTMLFRDNFDEQLIKERTDHKSDAVRTYKRTSEDQVKRISDVLQPLEDVKKVKPAVQKISEPQMKMPVVQSNNEGSYIKFSKGDVNLKFKLL